MLGARANSRASSGANGFDGLTVCSITIIGCGHIWDLTLVKGFNRGKKDVKKLYYSKTH